LLVLVWRIWHYSFVNKVFKTCFMLRCFAKTQLYLLMDCVFHSIFLHWNEEMFFMKIVFGIFIIVHKWSNPEVCYARYQNVILTLFILIKFIIITNFMALFKNIIMKSIIIKKTLCQNNPENWICFFISKIIWYLLKTMFRHYFS
jgi:hypothetical protein